QRRTAQRRYGTAPLRQRVQALTAQRRPPYGRPPYLLTAQRRPNHPLTVQEPSLNRPMGARPRKRSSANGSTAARNDHRNGSSDQWPDRWPRYSARATTPTRSGAGSRNG